MAVRSTRHVTIWFVALTGVSATILWVLFGAIDALPEANQQWTANYSTLRLVAAAHTVMQCAFVVCLIVHLFVLSHALNCTEELLEVARNRLMQPLDESHIVRRR